MRLRDHSRFNSLRQLSPIEAVQAWLDGRFGIGDEEALVEAIRKTGKISRSNEEISDIMLEGMKNKITATDCLKRIVGPALVPEGTL